MRTVLCAVATLAIVSVASGNVLVNGDWSTGDETGWIRSNPAVWGSNQNWSVTSYGPTAPEGSLTMDGGSFGWLQIVEVDAGATAELSLDWMANNAGWIEVMLWTEASEPDLAAVKTIFDDGDAAKTAFKEEGYTTAWEQATSLWPGGNDGTVVSDGWVIVGLKLGSGGGGAAGSFDNIVLTPEPATLLLLGMGLALVRRRR